MIDLNRLNQMLEEALSSESAESLSLWMEEQSLKDIEAGIIRNVSFEYINLQGMSDSLSHTQEAAIELATIDYIDYDTQADLNKEVEFDLNNDNNYNTAA